MEYRIGICDDNKVDIDYVMSLVKSWASVSDKKITIETFTSAEEFIFHYEDMMDYDILLLDIEMGEMNGVELAKKIRGENREVQIIFITGYNEYIADGYDVEALHYILKPVKEDKLNIVLNRACEKIQKNEKSLYFELSDGMVRIPLYEIRYVEVRSNYVTIHGNSDVSIKSTLSSIEKMLDDRFFRVGRSFIVNMKYIRRITKTDVHLEKDIIIPLARGYYELLNKAFISCNYL